MKRTLHEPSDFRDVVLAAYAALVDQTLAACASRPAESLLLAFALHGFIFAWPWPTELDHLPAAPCCVDPQTGARLYARYRVYTTPVDFALTIGDRKVAVVIDEAVPSREQAALDHSRDEALASAGWIMLRFTAAEIWRNADDSARQICEVLYGFASARIVTSSAGKDGQ